MNIASLGLLGSTIGTNQDLELERLHGRKSGIVRQIGQHLMRSLKLVHLDVHFPIHFVYRIKENFHFGQVLDLYLFMLFVLQDPLQAFQEVQGSEGQKIFRRWKRGQ